MDRKLRRLESFSVRGSDGKRYKVCGYEHLVRDESLPGATPERWLPTGTAEYRLEDGTLVDARADGSMRIARTGVELLPAAATTR